MRVLVVDVGGTGVKILVTGQTERRRFESGPTLTPRKMVAGVKRLAHGWPFDVVSLGYPGVVRNGRIVTDPYNLALGWVGFDFAASFGCPVRVLNDAAMQALGSFRRGKLLFLGLGAGLGTAMVVEGIVLPMEVGHLPYRKATFEDYLGVRGLHRLGQKRWLKHVEIAVALLTAALEPDDVVLGGGNAKRLPELPPGCRLGDNGNAFLGGFRLWEGAATR